MGSSTPRYYHHHRVKSFKSKFTIQVSSQIVSHHKRSRASSSVFGDASHKDLFGTCHSSLYLSLQLALSVCLWPIVKDSFCTKCHSGRLTPIRPLYPARVILFWAKLTQGTCQFPSNPSFQGITPVSTVFVACVSTLGALRGRDLQNCGQIPLSRVIS